MSDDDLSQRGSRGPAGHREKDDLYHGKKLTDAYSSRGCELSRAGDPGKRVF